MPNIDFDIVESPGETEVRVQAVRTEFANEVRTIVSEAVRRGAERARELAPRSDLFRNEGRRISDSIHYELPGYLPGGAGGGGEYEARFFASSDIAPHLKYVMEGTANDGAGHIFPAGGNLATASRGHHFTMSGVLAIEKEGEGVSFVRWVRGQRANSLWWEFATGVAERYVEERVHDIRTGT